jgi:hypothetical protein
MELHAKNYGKSSFFMGKLTINGDFHSYVKLPEGKWWTFNCHKSFDSRRVVFLILSQLVFAVQLSDVW